MSNQKEIFELLMDTMNLNHALSIKENKVNTKIIFLKVDVSPPFVCTVIGDDTEQLLEKLYADAVAKIKVLMNC